MNKTSALYFVLAGVFAVLAVFRFALGQWSNACAHVLIVGLALIIATDKATTR